MPNSTVDLHMHSSYSDGLAEPGDLLRWAAANGVKTVSITDHDNLAAARESAHIAEQLGLEWIPGVELTTWWAADGPASLPSQEVDLLGYFFDPQSPALLAYTQAAMQDLRSRMEDCCQRLRQAGYAFSIHDVLDENPHYPGTLPAVRALARRGLAGDYRTAHAVLCDAWSQVSPPQHSPESAIAVIHAAGGVAVLAHPVALHSAGQLPAAVELAPLVELGLDGLEVLHPRLDSDARLHFANLAKQFGLAVSGGSDEHGPAGGFTRLGSEPVTYAMVEALRARALAYQA